MSVMNFGPRTLKANGIRTAVRSVTADYTCNSGSVIDDGLTLTLDKAAGLTVTLPASSGSGRKFRFVVGTLLTSNTYKIQVANATDVMNGGVTINDIGDTSAATADFFPTASTSDTFTMTATLGAGKIGDWVEFEDISSGHWAVRGALQGVTDPATPFTAAVS